jgi:hypothetical protein
MRSLAITPLILLFALTPVRGAAETSPLQQQVKVQSVAHPRALPQQGDQKSSVKREQSKFSRGIKTVVSINGIQSSGDSACRLFDVEFSDILNFKILCPGQSLARIIDLKNTKDYMVSKRGSFTTITQYAYLIKKAQVSRLEQSTLKVPYVKEIIHLKKSEQGELAFYFESFKEDEFGRVVQVQQIQAHGLSNQTVQVSAN